MSASASRISLGLVLTLYVAASACSVASFRTQSQSEEQGAQSDDAAARAGKGGSIGSQEGSLPPYPLKVSQTFSVSELREGKLTVQAKSGELVREFVLASDYRDEKINFVQLTRPTEARSFRQGVSSHQSVTESFDQSALGILDLQLVIDNSRSMTSYQNLLAPRLQPLLRSLKNTDWQINVVTTDPRGSCSRALIRRGDWNADSAFASAVSPGVSGDSVEQGFRTARAGLECLSNPWLRPSSSVAVLIVSDEDNCSYNGSGCRGLPWETYTYLTGFISNNLGRTLGRDARIYGIIRVPSAECRDAPNSPQYEKAVSVSGGRYGAICSPDYTSLLEGISADMSSILKQDFILRQTPSPGSLQISVNGSLQAASTYSLIGQLVRFNDNAKPPFGAKISASYQVGVAPAITTRFALGENPLPGSVTAMINGESVSSTNFMIDESKSEIVFNPPPPEGAEIRVSFKKATELLKSFALDSRALPESLKVKVNGKAETNVSLNSGLLVFTESPPEGAAIEVQYRLKLGPLLQYTLTPANAASVTFLGLFDKATGARLDASFEAGQLTLAEASFVEGRQVLARYKTETSGLMEVELPQAPIDGTFKLASSAGECNAQLKDLLVTLNCSGAEGANLNLSWNYYSPKAISFTLDGIEKPETGKWEVAINGEPTQAYFREGTTITLSDEPEFQDRVTLTFTPLD